MTDLHVSFEFFPPKTEAMQQKLWAAVEKLKPLAPDFMSVTYGAGGSTRARTREVVQLLQNRSGVTAMAHLTCVNATRAELRALIEEYSRAGHPKHPRLARGPAQRRTAIHSH